MTLFLKNTRGLIVYPFSGISADFAVMAGRRAAATFNLTARTGDQLEPPWDALNKRRRQYRSGSLVSRMPGADELAGGPFAVLGITDLDIFVARLNYVFGQTDQARGCALVSLARLRPEFYAKPPNRQLFEERTEKEVVHELGHVFGLAHCPDPACIMHFSNKIEDTDSKGPGFCAICSRLLSQGPV